MRRLLASLALLAAFALPAKADFVTSLGVNPTSGAGAFANTDPGTGGGGFGAFVDIYNFTLVGDQILTIAFATNTYASGDPQFITAFTGAVVYEGADNAIGGGDDVVVIGPQLAAACVAIPNCQVFGGSANLAGGEYHLRVSGIAGVDAGYGGNLSTFAVPGPAVGAGLPGVIMASFLALGWLRRRRAAA